MGRYIRKLIPDKKICRECYDALSINMIMFMFLTGAILNVFAVARNDGRMPVYADLNLSTDKHFSTINKSEIREFNLVDKINIGKSYCSVGDLFMFFAITLSGAKIFFAVFIIDWNKLRFGRK